MFYKGREILPRGRRFLQRSRVDPREMTEEEQRTTKVGTAPDRTHVIDFTLQIIQVNCGPVVYAFFWCMIDLTLRHWDFLVIIRDWGHQIVLMHD